MNSVQMSRLRKTLFFNQYREVMEMFKQEVDTRNIAKSITLFLQYDQMGRGLLIELIAWDFMVEMYTSMV